MSKVTVIGAGLIGTQLAMQLAQDKVSQVVLIDTASDITMAKAIDLSHAATLLGSDTTFLSGTDYSLTKHSDVVVIAAGIPYNLDTTPEETLKANARIVYAAASEVHSFSPGAIFVVVTSPPDAISYVAWKAIGVSSRRVIGLLGLLLSARLQNAIAHQLSVSNRDVRAMVLGGNGDQMVPLTTQATVYGVYLSALLPNDTVQALSLSAAHAGAQIAKLSSSATAFIAPAIAAAQTVQAILQNTKRLIPCSVHPEGTYELDHIYIGLPAVIGANGVEQIVELPLSLEDHAKLQATAQQIRSQIDLLDIPSLSTVSSTCHP